MEANPQVSDESDRDAKSPFDAFYRDQWPRLVRLAWIFTGRMDAAEDLAQDALLAAHKQWDRIGAYDSPEAWIRRILLNHCVSRRRRYGTEIRSLLRLRQQRPAESVIDDHTDHVWSAVRTLPKRQRELIALVYLEDRSPVQAASILGIGETTARTHLRRALAKLSERLGSSSL